MDNNKIYTEWFEFAKRDLESAKFLMNMHPRPIENKAKDVYEYEIIQGYELESAKILQADVIDEEMLKEQKAVYITDAAKRRAMNRYYRMDSDGEYEFAEKLENDSNILLFTKLHKGGFVIDTPYGNYSPDWAIVYKNDNGDAKIYFIV